MKVIIFILILALTGFLPSGKNSVNAANLRCNAASKLKRTTIKNPANLNVDTCVYTIKPYNSNVCQLLIEFENFELQSPSLNSNTNTLECGDHLIIGDFTLCGNNTGQHLYFPFNVANGVKEFSMTYNLAKRASQSVWSLTITQLECPVANKHFQLHIPFLSGSLRTFFPMESNHLSDIGVLAPPGCNQYFTQSTGSIKSFNFKDGAAPSYYLPNMNYVICIKSPPESTMIEYHAVKFSMSNEVETSDGFDDDCRSAVQTAGRREDYLMIPQSFVADSLNIQPTYYCGISLQKHSSLLASSPFIMYFSSDGTTDKTETGFHINYRVRTLF